MRAQEFDERGQAHTLEAVVGAILILSSIGIALQITIVTPLSASTSSQHIETQQRATAQGVLAGAAEQGALQEAVVFWNDNEGNFHDATAMGHYTDEPPDNAFGEMLNRSFDQEGIAYNVNVVAQTPSGGLTEQEMVFQGIPSDNAVTATRTIYLHKNDTLIDQDGSETDTTVSEADTFYIGDAQGEAENHLYNVVRVEVVVWRI